MKRPALLLSVFALAGIMAVSAASYFLNGSYIARKISQVSERAGQSVRFGSNPVLTFFPPALAFGEIAWTGIIGSVRIDFTAESGTAVPDIIAILSGKPTLEELVLEKPRLLLARAAPLRPIETARERQPAPIPEIGRLVARDGAIILHTANSRLSLENLRLAARNLRPHQEMDIQSDYVARWQRDSREIITGNMAVKTKLRYYAPNLTYRDTSVTFTATDAKNTDAGFTLHAQMDGAFALDSLAARIHAAALTIPGLEIECAGEYQKGAFKADIKAVCDTEYFSPVQGRLEADGRLELSRNLLHAKGTLDVFGARGTGEAVMNLNGDKMPSAIEGKINLDWLNMENVGLKPASFTGNKTGHKSSVPLSDFNIEIDMAGVRHKQIQVGGIHLVLDGNAVHCNLKDFACKWAGGTITARGMADVENREYRLEASGEKIRLGKVLGQLGVPGLADGPASFSFQLSSKSAKNVLAGLSGAGRLVCENLRLEPFGELELLLPLMGRKGKNMPRALDSLRIAFKARDGRMLFSPLLATGPGFYGKGNAEVDLERDFINGSFLITVAGLELPIEFSGSVVDPQWRFGAGSSPGKSHKEINANTAAQ